MRKAMLWMVFLGTTPLLLAPLLAQDSIFTERKYLDLEGVAAPQISPDGQRIVFSWLWIDAVQDRRASMLWLMDADGGRPRQLLEGGNARWSPDGSRIAYLAEAGGKPQLWVRYMDAEGLLVQLTRGNEAPGDFRWSPDGNQLVQGWLVKPPGFNPAKRYPLILEIHGGPHGMYNVGFDPMFQNFAARGYLVRYTNPRGSTGYGTAFGNAIEKAYPSVDYDDLMAGVDEVIKRGWVDTTRMFVGGCSGGGVLSSWVVGHTNRFAAAAVRCPVTNWLSFAGQTDVPMFANQFFARPFWEDPLPYLKTSPIMYVGNVKTPTLLMTGELDLRTPMAQTEEFYVALRSRGVPTALLRFAGENHGTGFKPSNWMRTQLYMMAWYEKYGPAK